MTHSSQWLHCNGRVGAVLSAGLHNSLSGDAAGAQSMQMGSDDNDKEMGWTICILLKGPQRPRIWNQHTFWASAKWLNYISDSCREIVRVKYVVSCSMGTHLHFKICL